VAIFPKKSSKISRIHIEKGKIPKNPFFGLREKFVQKLKKHCTLHRKLNVSTTP